MRASYKIPERLRSQILREAISLSDDVRVDQLDCRKSHRRQPSNLSADSVIRIAGEHGGALYNFIYRDQSFLPQNFTDSDGKNPNRDYWDVGLSTLAREPELFLWIRLEVEDGWKLVKKHKLSRS